MIFPVIFFIRQTLSLTFKKRKCVSQHRHFEHAKERTEEEQEKNRSARKLGVCIRKSALSVRQPELLQPAAQRRPSQLCVRP